MAKLNCPADCQEKHNTTRENMAIITTKLDNIETKLNENTAQHEQMIASFKEISEKKADKKELDKINTIIWATVCALIGLLITIIFLLIKIE